LPYVTEHLPRKMKRRFFFWLVIVIFSPFRCASQTVPFAPGEMFCYEIKWNFLTSGSMKLRVVDEGEVAGEEIFHLQADTETRGFFRYLEPLRTKIESFVSQKDFFLLRYQFNCWAPREVKSESIEYPRGQKKGLWHQEKYKKKKGLSIKNVTFEAPEFFQDPLSILYYLRTRELKVGDQIKVPLILDRKNYTVTVKVLRRTKFKALGKVWDAFILQPGASLQGVPFQQGSLWMWISADELRVPLYFSARASLGVLSCTLVEAKYARTGD